MVPHDNDSSQVVTSLTEAVTIQTGATKNESRICHMHVHDSDSAEQGECVSHGEASLSTDQNNPSDFFLLSALSLSIDVNLLCINETVKGRARPSVGPHFYQSRNP